MTSEDSEPRPGGAPPRRDEIVTAAVPIFLRFGYKKASMDTVASAAHLSRQALYLHFSNKEALFGAVVENLCQTTRVAAHAALWREGLTLTQQILAAFDETMPHESMDLLSELLATARDLVPQSVANIDALVVDELSARIHDALGDRPWSVPDVTVERAAGLLQASSYGIKQQTTSREAYLSEMRSAIVVTLVAGGLLPPAGTTHRGSTRTSRKGS